MDNIKTQWHHIVDKIIKGEAVFFLEAMTVDTFKDWEHHQVASMAQGVWASAKDDPIYYFDSDVIRLIDQEKANKIMPHIINNPAMYRLPFERIIIEYEERAKVTKEQVAMIDPKIADAMLANIYQEKVRMAIIIWESKDSSDYPFTASIARRYRPVNSNKYEVQVSPCFYRIKFAINKDGDSSISVLHKRWAPKDMNHKSEMEHMELDRDEIHIGVLAVLLMLHTKGIAVDKEERPERLNKSRVAAGKPSIPEHRIVRIGHVYDRKGEKKDYNSSCKSMPVHWRSGHIRHQRFGKNLERSYELYIEPMLINYVDGPEPAMPVKKVKV